MQPGSGPSAAEQQAAEEVGLSRVLRPCSRRKAARGAGAAAWLRRHAAAAIIQLCRGPQPMHEVHQLQAALGAGAAASDAEAALLLPAAIRLLLQAAAGRQAGCPSVCLSLSKCLPAADQATGVYRQLARR